MKTLIASIFIVTYLIGCKQEKSFEEQIDSVIAENSKKAIELFRDSILLDSAYAVVKYNVEKKAHKLSSIELFFPGNDTNDVTYYYKDEIPVKLF